MCLSKQDHSNQGLNSESLRKGRESFGLPRSSLVASRNRSSLFFSLLVIAKSTQLPPLKLSMLLLEFAPNYVFFVSQQWPRVAESSRFDRLCKSKCQNFAFRHGHVLAEHSCQAQDSHSGQPYKD